MMQEISMEASLVEEGEQQGMAFTEMLQTTDNEIYEEWVNADVIESENTVNETLNVQVTTTENEEIEKEIVNEELTITTSKTTYPNVDVLLNSEIKEISAEMISELISGQVLNDVGEVHKQQVAQLEDIKTQVLSETEYLEREFERTMTTMVQSKEHILKGEEVTNILISTVDKLEKTLKEKCQTIKAMNATSKQQYENIKSCHSKIVDSKRKSREDETIIEQRKAFLELHLNSCTAIFNALKEKVDQLSQFNLTCDEQYEKYSSTKETMENNLKALKEQESQQQLELESKLSVKMDELKKLNDEKTAMIQKISELSSRKNVKQIEFDELKESTEQLQSEIVELSAANEIKKSELAEISGRYEDLKKTFEERNAQHYTQSEEMDNVLRLTENDLLASNKEIDKLLQAQKDIQSNLIKKCEEKNQLIKQIFEKKNDLRNIKQEVEQRKTKNVALNEKVISLQHSYETMKESIELKDNEIISFKEKSAQQLTLASADCDNLEADYKKRLEMLNKERGSNLVSNQYFKERLADLNQNIANVELQNKGIMQENEGVVRSIETKNKELLNMKSKLQSIKTKYYETQNVTDSKKKAKPNVKPFGDRSPKKVTFNNVLFVKQSTESDENYSPDFGPKSPILQDILSCKDLYSDAIDLS